MKTTETYTPQGTVTTYIDRQGIRRTFRDSCGPSDECAEEPESFNGTVKKYEVRKLRFRGDEMLEPCKPVFATDDQEEAVNWMTGYVDSLYRQGKRGGEWAVFERGEEMFTQSYGFGHKFAKLC